MNQIKLKKLLEVFDPSQGTKVDFTELDIQVSKLKEALKEKIQVQTIDDVYSQLEKFKKKLDFKGMFEAISKLETTLNLKIQGVTGLLNEEIRSFKKLLGAAEKVSQDQIASVASNIKNLESELAALDNQKTVDIAGLRDKIEKLLDFTLSANDTFLEIEKKLDKKDNIKEFTEALEKVRQEFNNRLSNFHGGGNANRNIAIGGNTSVLSRYTDINIKAGSNVTLSYSNNNTSKYLDLTIAATGGAGTTRSIETITVSSIIGTLADTDQVILANGGIQITLPTAVSDTNLYTIKNVGTSSVLIGTTGGQTIDGQSNIIMPVQYTSVDLVSDDSNFNIT